MRAFPFFVAAAAVVALATAPCAANALEQQTLDIEALEELNLSEPDREGLRRDTWYFLGYQWITIGILYIAPESVSGWTDEQKEEYSLSVWWDNVTSPQWDSDDFYLNYIMHPYWGAAYYVRARERGARAATAQFPAGTSTILPNLPSTMKRRMVPKFI